MFCVWDRMYNCVTWIINALLKHSNTYVPNIFVKDINDILSKKKKTSVQVKYVYLYIFYNFRL